jgi:hypothetical protein
MRRAGLLALLVVVLAGTLAVAIVGASEKRTLAFTLGVPPSAPMAVLTHGSTMCQQPIAVPSAFDAVELQAGTYMRPGPALAVLVRRMQDGTQLGHGTLASGYPDVAKETVPVGTIPKGEDVAVCITNDGARRVALYGAADAAARDSTALVDGRPTNPPTDVALVFRMKPRSMLAIVPDVLQRMSLFHGGWIGAWLYWLLLVVVVVAVPALLGRALVSALRDGPDEERPADR